MYFSEGVAVLIPHEDKLKLRSCSVCWPEVVAVFILNEDKFKLRSYSIFWPEGVAVLIPYCNKFRLLFPSMYCSFNILAREGCSFDPLSFNKLYSLMYFSEGGSFGPS